MAHPLIDGAEPGDVIALVGPNGAGKSTLLRRLAAEHQPDVGLVFQDRLLFPHMTALDNVAFGLRHAGLRKHDARQQAREWLERLHVADLAARKPDALSGGEAQRVAVARALARRPRVLLLDEPFAAVDVEAAAVVRAVIRAEAAGRVTVLVTHQPLDVLALANKVAVMEAGEITQTGTVDDVRTRPRSPWIARMVGVNLLKGTATAHGIVVNGTTVAALTDVRGEAFAVVHPRAVTLSNEQPHTSARNAWPGRLADVDIELDRVRVRVQGAVDLVAEITPAAYSELTPTVWASVKATEVEVYPA